MKHTSEKHPDKLNNNVLNSNLQVSTLFGIFFNRLHPLYSIDCAALLIYDDEGTTLTESFTSVYGGGIKITDQPTALSALQKEVAGFSFPVLKTACEWVEETGLNHQPVNTQSAYAYHCYVPLEANNRVLGTLELHNETEQLSTECLAFCCSIADWFADILQRQQSNANSGTSISIASDIRFGLDLSEVNSLEDLLDIIAVQFPSVHTKIAKQVNELRALTQQHDDAVAYAQPDDNQEQHYPGIIGVSTGMQRVFSLINRVANSDSTILILGETGTGKELIAKAIHQHSGRAANNMVSINCAAIPANLIESELFGHEKGAFTGATDKRIGKFELADNSTLFLDEVGEIPLDLQVKLLRALQEKEIERIGGKTAIKCNVRIIAATNRNLLHEVEKGRFRRDLYFRLNVIPIALPALRERNEDIALLATHFINKYAAKSNKQVTGLTKGAVRQLRSYSWPGNVREMEHLLERHVLLSPKPIISHIELPAAQPVISGQRGRPKTIKTIDENERDHIFEVLKLCNGRVSGPHGAAKLLGVPATTLNSKIKKLGLNKKHF